MPRHFTHLLTLFLMATLGGLAQPSGKLARDLPVQGTEKVDVIIQFNNPPGQQDLDQVRGQGGELTRQLPAINGALSVEVASAVWGTRTLWGRLHPKTIPRPAAPTRSRTATTVLRAAPIPSTRRERMRFRAI